MKKIILSLLLISTSVFSQTKSERLEIVKDYDFAKQKQFKTELVEFYSDKENRIKNYLLLNPQSKRTFSKESVLYTIDDINENGLPIYLSTSNRGAAITTRANKLYSGGGLGLNIQGQNMIAGVWEIGSMNTLHGHFQNRGIQKDLSTAAHSDHATHVTGTIIQKGSSSLLRGMAFDGGAWANDITNEFTEMVDQSFEGLLISNHSYGIPFLNAQGALQVDVEDAGKYDAVARVVDIVHNLAPYYLAVYAAGNERASSASINAAGGYDMMSFRTVSKNAMVVGAVNGVTTYAGPSSVVMSSFSNWGPTDDGRIKPDLVGKGVAVTSTTGGAAGSTQTSSFDGTSMSAPNVTGTLLLLQQYYKQLNGRFLRAASLKGLALHSADEAGTTVGPDYRFGWGLCNAEAGANIITNDGLSSSIQELTLNPGETKTFTVTAQGGTVPLMASISWTDPEALANTAGLNDRTPSLVNDLDIRVSNTSTTILPWKLDPANPNNAAVKADNLVDPFEKVQVDAASGTYTITVTHKGTLAAPQNFTLILSGINSPFAVRTALPNNTKCISETAQYSLQYFANSTTATNFVVTGLPAGVTSAFSVNNLTANSSFNLNLSNFNALAPGVYPFTVTGTNGSVSKQVQLSLTIYSPTFTSVTGFLPANNQVEVSVYANLSWTPDVNAQSYQVDVATDNAFTNIIQSGTVTTPSFLTNLLNINTDYFWRVKQINLCGSASYTSAGKFKTVNLECGVQTYSGSPIAIADVANTLVTSTMAFNNPNITSIYDLDVSLNLTHTYVQDMTISLVSPSGTTVILQEEACGSQNDINVVYDDSGNNIVCGSVSPAISGRVKSFQVLSALNGQNPNGNWQLIVDDPYNGDGGFINSWSLNICKIVPLSASDFDKNKFKIYPNPTNNSVSVLFEDLQITGYVVYDIQGREILSKNKQFSASFDIDLSSFNSGIYLLKIVTDKGDFTQKVIKN